MFRLILAIIIWGFFHSLLASMKAKELALRWFGKNLARFYRLAHNLVAGLCFLRVLVIAGVTPDRRLYSVPLPWSALMGMGEFLAVVVLILGFRQTDAWEFLGLRQLMGDATSGMQEGPVETVRGHLVTLGMYQYVRHPLYSAGIFSSGCYR